MKYLIVGVVLAAGCYRSGPAPAPPSEPTPRPVERAQHSFASAHSRRPPPPTRTAMADAIDKLTELTDEMCACSDKPCADAVVSELTQWSTDMAQQRSAADEQPTADEVKQATEVTDRLSRCMVTAMTAGASAPSSTP